MNSSKLCGFEGDLFAGFLSAYLFLYLFVLSRILAVQRSMGLPFAGSPTADPDSWSSRRALSGI